MYAYVVEHFKNCDKSLDHESVQTTGMLLVQASLVLVLVF